MAYRSNTYYCEANVNNIFTLDHIIYINYWVLPSILYLNPFSVYRGPKFDDNSHDFFFTSRANLSGKFETVSSFNKLATETI